jgi:hypothetical protein
LIAEIDTMPLRTIVGALKLLFEAVVIVAFIVGITGLCLVVGVLLEVAR